MDLLHRCLRGLAAQDAVSYEVIVVHEGNPEIVSLLDSWRGRLPLRGLASPHPGAAIKRNLGWRAAQADLVAFTDDDCEPAPGWLTAVVGVFASDPGVDLVQGPVRAHPDDAHVDGLFARVVTVEGPTETYPAANVAMRRTAIEQVGGFDPQLAAGEDTDLAWRIRELGGGAAYAEAGVVLHAVRPVTLVTHLRSLARWGDLPLVVRRHPQLRRLCHRQWLWKESHATAVPALVGLLLAPRVPAAGLLGLPHLLRRLRQRGVRAGVALTLSDLAEVAVLAIGSARHRSILL
jgi:cellulose synthase/poly-beta-1,6-N-acetylglucosamine synthase-like glycosyltransferase